MLPAFIRSIAMRRTREERENSKEDFMSTARWVTSDGADDAKVLSLRSSLSQSSQYMSRDPWDLAKVSFLFLRV